MLQTPDLVAEISQSTVLNAIPGIGEFLATQSRLVTFENNEKVVIRGQAVDRLLIPITATLASQDDNDEDLASTPGIRKFEVLGLQEMFAGDGFRQTIVARCTTFVLTVAKDSFLKLLDRTPGVAHYLRLRSVSQCLMGFQETLRTQNLTSSDIVRVMLKIDSTPKVLAAGDGVPGDTSVWFVESGAVEVTPLQEGSAVRLTAGDFFGGECLVSPYRCELTATAAVDNTVLYEMPGADARLLLLELNLIEFLCDEPCLNVQPLGGPRHLQSGALDETAVAREARALPGITLSTSDVGRYGLQFNVGALIGASIDTDANVASVINLLIFLDAARNRSSLSTELGAFSSLTYLKIAETIEPYGVSARAMRATMKTLPRHTLPALVALEGRLCVLVGMNRRRKRLAIHDPVQGFLELTFEEFVAIWDEMLLETYRSEFGHVQRDTGTKASGLAAVSPPRPTLKDQHTVQTLASILTENRRLLANIALLSVLTVGLSVVQPWLSQVVLDEVLTLKDMSVLATCVAGLLLSAVSLAVIRYVQQILFAEFANAFDTRLGEHFYRRALGLSIAFFSRNRAGDVLTRLRELEHIREFLSLHSLQVVVKVFSVAVVISVLALYRWQIALLALCLGCATLIFQVAISKTLYGNFAKSVRESMRAMSLMVEQVAAVSTVKSLCAARVLRERWEKAFLNARQLALKNELLLAGSNTFLQLMGAVARIGGLWLAIHAAFVGELSPGQILAVSAYLNHVIESVLQIGGFFGEIWNVRTAFDNVRGVLDAPPGSVLEESRSYLEHAAQRQDQSGKGSVLGITKMMTGFCATSISPCIPARLSPSSGKVVVEKRPWRN
ncbi:MAG: ABC transporter transmembrane domain-containing protein [Myxococcota bacterium]